MSDSVLRSARERLDRHVREIVKWHFDPSTGCPFWIERAKQLLTETKETLIDIGLQVGCADQSHFTALFHKHMGLTPKAYRDSLRS